MAQRKINCEVYTDRGIVGKEGAEGKSAYQQAVSGGYQGTEEEFEQALASDIATVADNVTNINAVGNNIENVNTAVDNMSAIIAAPTAATQAAASASQSATSSTNAQTSETNAATSASNAAASATNASASATTATTKASEATASATSASASATSASTSATSASTSATNAQTWAEGADAQVTTLGGEHSAKGWANVSKQYAESIGAALKYKGSVSTYSALPSNGQEIGDTWNVLDTGDNYAWTGIEWDKLSGTVDLSAYRTSADQDIIDATKATKAELDGYLPLSGGTINGELKVVGPKSTIRTYSGNETSGYTYLELKAADQNQAAIRLTNNRGETIFRQRGSNTEISNLVYNKSLIISSTLTFDNNKVLDASDKAVANGVASLDANAKVPSEQIPTATTSTLGGVKPDGTTITVTEDGTISAATSSEFATKAELQEQAAVFQQGLSGKADTNLGNIPSNYDYVVESYKDDQGNWYRKYKSGWLEQGGLAYASSGETSVTLLKPYADTGFALIATNEQTNNINAYGWIYISSKTTTGFTIKSRRGNGEAVTCNAMWEAKGQGAE